MCNSGNSSNVMFSILRDLLYDAHKFESSLNIIQFDYTINLYYYNYDCPWPLYFNLSFYSKRDVMNHPNLLLLYIKAKSKIQQILWQNLLGIFFRHFCYISRLHSITTNKHALQCCITSFLISCTETIELFVRRQNISLPQFHQNKGNSYKRRNK